MLATTITWGDRLDALQSSEENSFPATPDRVRLLPLVKYFLYVFAVEAIISFAFPRDFLIENLAAILALNVGSSAVLGWFLYRRRDHLRLRMDQSGFNLSQGMKQNHRFLWREFAGVSLVKDDNEDLYVRLYRRNDTHFDLPASKLKLDAFEFRRKIQSFVEAA